MSGTSRHFLVYANYDALLDYNCAHAYALSVAVSPTRSALTRNFELEVSFVVLPSKFEV